MINLLKRKISDGCYAADVAIITIALIAGGLIWHGFASASISNFSIAPIVLGTDDVVGGDPDYTVSYETDSTGTVSTITVTFPAEYVVFNTLVRDVSSFIRSSNGTPGTIAINGVDETVLGISSNNQEYIITLATPFDYSVTPGSDTIAFDITSGLTNPTVAGVKPAADFMLEDDAAGNTAVQASGSVTIIPGPAFTLDFTTEPSQTPAPANGDLESGVVWTVQPIVTAHDRYGNVATSYNTDVVSLTLAGGAPGTISFGTASPDLCGGYSFANSFQVRADNGVADFSGALASYYATADHETFALEAVHTCGSNNGSLSGNGTSVSSFVVDAVATDLEWSASPSGCVTDTVCTTQGTVLARSILGLGRTRLIVTDVDYTGDVTISHNGTGTLVGTALQGAMTAGSITLSGIGYTLASAATPETINFVATSGSLTQGESDSVTVTVAPVASPSPRPTPVSIGGGINPRFDERPTTEPVATAPGGTGSRTSPASAPTGSSNTVAPTSSCAPYITSYMKLGSSGEEVVKLQQFLLKYGFFQDEFTGFFGEQTEEAVKRFQEQYTQDVLKYWGLTEGTGYVYITTTKKINELVCQES